MTFSWALSRFSKLNGLWFISWCLLLFLQTLRCSFSIESAPMSVESRRFLKLQKALSLLGECAYVWLKWSIVFILLRRQLAVWPQHYKVNSYTSLLPTIPRILKKLCFLSNGRWVSFLYLCCSAAAADFILVSYPAVFILIFPSLSFSKLVITPVKLFFSLSRIICTLY